MTTTQTTWGRKVLAVLLTLAPLSATTAYAADVGIDLGTSCIDAGVTTGDVVYFGRYPQEAVTNVSGYSPDEYVTVSGKHYLLLPIAWRVLSKGDGKLFLLAANNLDAMPYHVDNESVTYAQSTIRSWLNGYAAYRNTGGASGIDYSASDKNFFDIAFSSKEQKAILDTVVTTNTYQKGTNLTSPVVEWYTTTHQTGSPMTDKIFLLSTEEAAKTAYGFEHNLQSYYGYSISDTRLAANTHYTASKSGMKAAGQTDCWWLRSPGNSANIAAYVHRNGHLRADGTSTDDGGNGRVDGATVAVRPALNLDMSYVIFTSVVSPATLEKEKSSVDVGDGFVEAEAPAPGKGLKLTIYNRDELALYEGFPYSPLTTAPGGTVNISHWEAWTGADKYVSAVIANSSGHVLYYSKLTNNKEAATVSVVIPFGIAPGNYTIRIFNEQVRWFGYTDFATSPISIPLTVTPHTDFYPLTVTAGTGGAITAGANGSFPAGQPFTITASADDGYLFSGWTSTSGGAFANADYKSTTFTMPAGATTVTANFTRTWDVAYYGNYEQANDGGDPEPIAWRVLSNDGGKLFLLAEKGLNAKPYHVNTAPFTYYAQSTIRSWLNGYAAAQNTGGTSGIDYSPPSENFLDKAFTAAEQAAIAETTVNTYTFRSASGTSGGEWYTNTHQSGSPTMDKIFLLSTEEATNPSYGFEHILDGGGYASSATRYIQPTAYAIANGAYRFMWQSGNSPALAQYEGNGYWWLRSPGIGGKYAAFVSSSGHVDATGDSYAMTDSWFSIRPALNLDLSSVVFASAASGANTKSAAAVDGGLIEAGAPGANLKFTIPITDTSFLNLSVADRSTRTVAPGDTIDVVYSGAITGVDKYVSAVIANSSGDVLYYGKLSSDEAGTAGIVVPAGITPGNYTIRMFNEQANGDRHTDFASTPVDIPLTVKPADTAGDGNDGKTGNDNDGKSPDGNDDKTPIDNDGKTPPVTTLPSTEITEPPVPMANVPATKTPIAPGMGAALPKSVTFSDGTSADVTWTSGNPAIAKIDAGGNIVAVGEGKVTLTARAADGKTQTITVTVAKPVTAVRTPLTKIYLKTGKPLTPPVCADSVNPVTKKAETTAKLTWKSSKPKIAAVNPSTGKITPKKSGKATITATALNDKKLTITVTVVKKAALLKKVTLTKPPKSLKVGKTALLKVKTSPAKATNLKVTFKSNKPKIIQVDKAGKLTALKKGKAKITVKIGNRKYVREITVK
jgi:uncharacterized protein YjdB